MEIGGSAASAGAFPAGGDPPDSEAVPGGKDSDPPEGRGRNYHRHRRRTGRRAGRPSDLKESGGGQAVKTAVDFFRNG